MKTTTEYSQKLVELIERSAKINRSAVKSRQSAADAKQELEELRAKQREASRLLRQLEDSSGNSWENIGGGGSIYF